MRAQVAKRVRGRFLEAAERHVGDHQRARAAARDAAHVVLGLLDRHRQGRVVALDHHAERVADQQHVDAGLVGEPARSSRRSR
jgi:hypothetical protein